MKKTKHLFMLFASVFAINVNAQESSPIPKSFENATVPTTTEQQSTVAQPEAEKEKLDEVVVTALGIKKSKKALGYAVSTISSELLESRPESDMTRLLNGKAAGVDINASSGLTGSATNINIRGFSSITGSSQPLFVIDGVPFNSGAFSSTGSSSGSDFQSGSQGASRNLDIDPNNIESVSILKGLSATVLYGESGRNGVILITTKTGSSTTNKNAEQFNLSVSQSVNIVQAAFLPETQTTWGGGFDNGAGLGFFSNWGAKMEGQLLTHPYDKPSLNTAFPQYKGVQYEYKNYNSLKNFFSNVGVASNTNISMSAGNEKGKINMSFSNLRDQGYLPTNQLNKYNFSLGGIYNLSSGLTLAGTFNYVESEYTTPPISYSSGSSAQYGYSVFGDIMYTPLTVDLMNLPYENPTDNSSLYYRPNNDIQNPLWTLNNVKYTELNHRSFGNLSLKQKLNEKFGLSYRIGYDNSDLNILTLVNKGGKPTANNPNAPLGGLITLNINSQIWDHVGMVTFKDNLTKDIDLNIEAGVNYKHTSNDIGGIFSTGQIIYGIGNHSNFLNSSSQFNLGYLNANIENKEKQYSLGYFIQSTLGYNNSVFLNLGGRYSVFSTLESGNNTLFYPSVSLSGILSDLIPSIKSDLLNYLKVRVGFATSANVPSPYNTRTTGSLSARSFISNSGAIINTGGISNILANPNLKPELLQEIETGVEAQLFNNKISVEATYFYKFSKNQILLRTLDRSTGYGSQYINAGTMINQGIELAVGLTAYKNKDWNINVKGLFYKYKNKIADLPSDIKSIVLNGFSSLGNFAENGQAMNIIKGTYRKKAPDGQYIVNKSTGNYELSQDIDIIGDPNPAFKTSGILTVEWKRLVLGTQVDYTHGGQIYSVTARSMIGRGLAKETDIDRFQSVILKGVNENTDDAGKKTYTQNQTQTSATTSYFNNGIGGSDISIYDASIFRLREVSLGYTIDKKYLMIKGKSIIKSISLSVIVNNLWYFAPGFPSGYNIDTEVNGVGGGTNSRGFEFMTGPSARKYSFNLKLNF